VSEIEESYFNPEQSSFIKPSVSITSGRTLIVFSVIWPSVHSWNVCGILGL